MWSDRVSNPGLLTYESGALPTALRGPAKNEVGETNNILRLILTPEAPAVPITRGIVIRFIIRRKFSLFPAGI